MSRHSWKWKIRKIFNLRWFLTQTEFWKIIILVYKPSWFGTRAHTTKHNSTSTMTIPRKWWKPWILKILFESKSVLEVRFFRFFRPKILPTFWHFWCTWKLVIPLTSVAERLSCSNATRETRVRFPVWSIPFTLSELKRGNIRIFKTYHTNVISI